jgi:hypothetical protein
VVLVSASGSVLWNDDNEDMLTEDDDLPAAGTVASRLS